MAGTNVFAIRYAYAFASVAQSASLDVAVAQQQLNDFAATLAGSRELREVLSNPSIPADQKLGLLDALAERIGMFREVRNFIAVMMDHQRLGELSEILAEYHRIANVSAGVAEALVTSARTLDEAGRHELEVQVGRLAGSRVRITYEQDAALLGGAIIQIGSTIYDGSVRAQLEQMKQALVRA